MAQTINILSYATFEECQLICIQGHSTTVGESYHFEYLYTIIEDVAYIETSSSKYTAMTLRRSQSWFIRLRPPINHMHVKRTKAQNHFSIITNRRAIAKRCHSQSNCQRLTLSACEKNNFVCFCISLALIKRWTTTPLVIHWKILHCFRHMVY